MSRQTLRGNSMLQAWNVIYPIFLYYVVLSLAAYLAAILVNRLTGEPMKYYMLIQTAATVTTIPFIFYYYRQDKQKPTVFQDHLSQEWKSKPAGKRILNGTLAFVLGAAAGIVLNNLMALTHLEQMSRGYQQVTEDFFSGGILFELLGACLLTPVLEELLYRGVTYGRLCDLMIGVGAEHTEKGKRRAGKCRFMAMVISALIFGVMHRNLIQFIYAALLGVLLAWLMERTGHLYGAVLAHIGANLMSVLRVETKVLAWMEKDFVVFLSSTALLAAVSLGAAYVVHRANRKKDWA